jgi:hypothetical protein
VKRRCKAPVRHRDRSVDALALMAALGDSDPKWALRLLTLVALNTADGTPLSGAWS